MIRRAAAVVTAGLWAAVLAGPAIAQEADNARLEALETRLEALSRQAEAIASQARRLQELEDSLRAVTGAMQENRHLLDQIRGQLRQLEGAQAELNAAAPEQAPVQTAGAGEEPGTGGTAPAEGQPVPAAEVPPVPVTQFDDEEASYRRAYELLGLADYAGAEVAFREFIRNYPNSTLTDNAYYWLGESHYVREQYEQAAAEFARGFRSAPDKQKAPDILLKLGLSLMALGENDDACQAFQRLESDFPDASKRTRDRAVLGP